MKIINFIGFSSYSFFIFFTLERGPTSLDHFIEIEMSENECVIYKFQLGSTQCCPGSWN